VRRLFAGLIALFCLAGLILVLPVFSSPAPQPKPVATRTAEVSMGSLAVPAAEAAVQVGPSRPIDGVPETTPTLRLSRTDVAQFSLVGVTWAADEGVTDTLVLVRTQDRDGTWADWTEVATELATQDAGTNSGGHIRGGTDPLWTGQSVGVEVELVTRSGAQPTDVQLDLVDPGSSEADGSLKTPDIQDIAQAGATMPAVYSRAQWGADESLRTWDPQYAPTIKAATLHHTADTNAYTADQVPAMLRSIYRYHAVNLGWGDIGYNVLVDKFGRLWEGRSGGLASTVIGAHAGGFNTSTFGVSMLGNYDTAPTTSPMIDAVAAIIAWKFTLYGVDPRGSTTLTSAGGGTAKYAAGTKVTLPTIFGHRDVGSTVCPGQYGYAQLGNIRSIVASMGGSFISPVDEYYAASPDVRSLLGNPLSQQGGTADGQGLYRRYERGAIYWSPGTGAHAVSGGVAEKWNAAGADRSGLRLPTSDMVCGLTAGGCRQEFQGGTVVWSPGSGAWATNGAIAASWVASGRESGPLGYPSSDMGCGFVRGGCGQQFEHGSLYWSPASGAYPVTGPMWDYWVANGWERGALGYATSNMVCTSGGAMCRQDFEGQTVFWSQGSSEVLTTSGAIRALWRGQGAESGWLGMPAEAMVCGAEGCRQSFQHGVVTWTAADGARFTNGAIAAAWRASGLESGPLGYLSGDMGCGMVGGGCGQQFAHGSLYWSTASGAHPVTGPVWSYWVGRGWERGALGYATADMVCGLTAGGCRQEFGGVTVMWSPGSGAHGTNGAIAASWVASGRESGPLGYPSGEMGCGMVGGGCGQQFEHGSSYWSPASGAHPVTGPIWDYWVATGWERGVLGYATADLVCGSGVTGCRQDFQGATATWSQATGAQNTSGAIRALWLRDGAQAGSLGVPSAPMVCGATGCSQQFQGGTVTWTSGTGAVVTSGPIAAAWVAAGAQDGSLRYPSAPMQCGLPDGGCRQTFQGGTLTWSPGTNAVTPS
jgi:uncharacterized protein with LGFP repeats